jgi:hypothetical protein
MFYTKDHKTPSMFEPFSYLGTKRLKRMKQSWAGLFRDQILAELPVERILSGYHPDQGRPSKELYAMLGAVLLQQMLDLTDEETVDQFAFNLQWHYALDITGESDQAAYLCPKTLWNMRSMVMDKEVAPVLFDVLTDQLKRVFEVDTGKQRLDSMHLVSNMRHLGRVGRMARTIRKFLLNLKRKDSEQFAALEQEVRERYVPRRGEAVFALVKPSQSERTLQTLARDLWDLIERFGSDPAIRAMHSYQLLVRVFCEQCRVQPQEAGGSRQVGIKAPGEVPSDSLQNPSDPDATYDGHKGKGYQVQVMESYTEREPESDRKQGLNLITYVQAQGAHESDSQAVGPALEKSRQQGRAPKQLLADSLYGSDDNDVHTRLEGVQLVAPVKTNKKAPVVGLADFVYDECQRVTACPQGHAPLKTYWKKQRHSAQLDSAVCAQCPLRGECPVKPGRHGNYLRYSHKELRIEQRKAHEQTDEFRDRYRFRSGCEATMSELDRKTGIKRLRVRGMPAVTVCVFLKAAGLNILRATRFANRRCQPENSPLGPILPRRTLWHLDQKAFRACLAAFRRLLSGFPVEAGDDIRFGLSLAT